MIAASFYATGEKIYEGSLKRNENQQPRYMLESPNLDLAQPIAEAGHRFADDGTVQLMNGTAGPDLLKKFVGAGVRVESWAPQHKTLEDVYLELSAASAKS